MKKELSKAALYRLCGILRILEEFSKDGVVNISSGELGEILDETAYSIRKDISFLDNIISGKKGYVVRNLIEEIKNKLNLNERKKASIVGLGRIGTAILNYSGFEDGGYDIVVGFDSSTNKIETMKTEIELYPSYEIEDVVKMKKIELGIIAVPAQFAQEIANRLINSGVKGIINFAPVIIKANGVYIKNIDLITEFNFLSAVIK